MLKHALKNRYKSNFAVTVLKREINSPDTKSNLSACRNTNAGQQLLTDPKSAGSRNVSYLHRRSAKLEELLVDSCCSWWQWWPRWPTAAAPGGPLAVTDVCPSTELHGGREVLPKHLRLLSTAHGGQGYKSCCPGGNRAAGCGGLNQSLYLGRSRTEFATKSCAMIGEKKHPAHTFFFLLSLRLLARKSQDPSQKDHQVCCEWFQCYSPSTFCIYRKEQWQIKTVSIKQTLEYMYIPVATVIFNMTD